MNGWWAVPADPGVVAWVVVGVIAAASVAVVGARERLGLAMSPRRRARRRALDAVRSCAEALQLEVDPEAGAAVGRRGGRVVRLEHLGDGAMVVSLTATTPEWDPELRLESGPVDSRVLRPVLVDLPGEPGAQAWATGGGAAAELAAAPEVLAALGDAVALGAVSVRDGRVTVRVLDLGRVPAALDQAERLADALAGVGPMVWGSGPAVWEGAAVAQELERIGAELGLPFQARPPRLAGELEGRRVEVAVVPGVLFGPSGRALSCSVDLHAALPPGFVAVGRSAPSAHQPAAELDALQGVDPVATARLSVGCRDADAALRLLREPGVAQEMAELVGDDWGSRVNGERVVLVRPLPATGPPAAWVGRAVALAALLDRSADADWLRFAAAVGLSPSARRSAGHVVLCGQFHDCDVTVAIEEDNGEWTTVRATPRSGPVVPGLVVRPREPGEPEGQRTGDPIVDQVVVVQSPTPLPQAALGRLRADIVLGLLKGRPGSTMGDPGVVLRMRGKVDMSTLQEGLMDAAQAALALPRRDEVPPPPAAVEP